jgi:outer membrane protein OmpA-like peptidoglycan-associated protein
MKSGLLGFALALAIAPAALAQTPPAQYSADAIKERLSGVSTASAPSADPNCQTYEQRISNPACAAKLETNEQLFPYRGAKPATAVTGTIKRPPVPPRVAAKQAPKRGKAVPSVTSAAAAASCVDQVGDEASGLNLCVTFALGSASLTAQAMSNLDQFAVALGDPQLQALKFAVEGHADRQGSDAVNKALSQKRAEAVVAYLTGKSVASDRLTAAGFSAERPIVGKSPSDPANRRVEARLIR